MAKSKGARFFCDHCGIEVPAKTSRCPNCGRFFSSVRCPQCGLTGHHDTFLKGCPSCGYSSSMEEAAGGEDQKVKPAWQPMSSRVFILILGGLLSLLFILLILFVLNLR